MIWPSAPPSGPLVLPGVAVWRIDRWGRLARIDCAWEVEDGIAEASAESVTGWLDLVKTAWKATAPRSPERHALTHWMLPGGQDGWLKLVSEGMDVLPDWEIRRVSDAISGATVKLNSRIRLHLGSAEALTGTDWTAVGLTDEELTARGMLGVLRRLMEGVGVTGNCPGSLTGIACRIFRGAIRYPIVTPEYGRHLEFQQDAVTTPRIEALPGEWGPGVQYDRNAAYVDAMRRVRVPVSPVGHWTRHYEGDGIYRGEFSQPQDRPPLLRDAPSGEFRYSGEGTYCANEVDALLDAGGTFDVQLGYRFYHCDTLLRPFAETCWELRERTDEYFARVLAKQLPLRLYGIMLSQGHQSVLVPHDERCVEGEFKLLTVDVAEIERQVPTPWRFPAVGAFVLAEGRIAIWREMCRVLEAGGVVPAVYVDSLVVVGAELPSSREIGATREEARGMVYVTDPQRVRVGRRTRAGGAPRHLAAEAIAQGAAGIPTLVRWESAATLREVLVEGIAAGARVERHTTIRNRVGSRAGWQDAWVQFRRPWPRPEMVEGIEIPEDRAVIVGDDGTVEYAIGAAD